METLYFLGIDVSKKTIDIALTIDGKHFHNLQVENHSKSIAAFFKELENKISSLSNLIVCLEHTGIYCNPLLEVLVRQKINICVEPAIQIKQSQGMTRGKNDKVDAERIALYALRNKDRLKFWKPEREVIQRLKAMLVTRERLVKMRVQLEGPIREANEFIDPKILKEMTTFCASSIKAINRDIERVEQAIDQLVKSDAQLSTQCDLATSVPGIGKITALNMITTTAEFTKIQGAKKFACYSGVAPFEHSSGSSYRGKTRVSKMANMTMKKLLHLAAMSAIQSSEELKVYYHRKLEAGKNKMSVINAVRNKLISRVFACITNQRKYQKIYQHGLA